MARGWESKSVEAQIEETATAQPPAGIATKRTPEQVQNLRERKNLELARAKVVGELSASQNPRYTEMLNRALAELDQKLARLK